VIASARRAPRLTLCKESGSDAGRATLSVSRARAAAGIGKKEEFQQMRFDWGARGLDEVDVMAPDTLLDLHV
jgi:hypothetical protein